MLDSAISRLASHAYKINKAVIVLDIEVSKQVISPYKFSTYQYPIPLARVLSKLLIEQRIRKLSPSK